MDKLHLLLHAVYQAYQLISWEGLSGCSMLGIAEVCPQHLPARFIRTGHSVTINFDFLLNLNLCVCAGHAQPALQLQVLQKLLYKFAPCIVQRSSCTTYCHRGKNKCSHTYYLLLITYYLLLHYSISSHKFSECKRLNHSTIPLMSMLKGIYFNMEYIYIGVCLREGHTSLVQVAKPTCFLW